MGGGFQSETAGRIAAAVVAAEAATEAERISTVAGQAERHRHGRSGGASGTMRLVLNQLYLTAPHRTARTSPDRTVPCQPAPYRTV